MEYNTIIAGDVTGRLVSGLLDGQHQTKTMVLTWEIKMLKSTLMVRIKSLPFPRF